MERGGPRRPRRAGAARAALRPGFSTRSEAGKLSGRGVGLDVVRTNIERLGGTIELHSRLGRGTTVRVKIPLTLAIVPALIVTCAGQRFAIPQVNLIEIVRVPAAARRERFATIHGAAVLRLRGHLLPMTALARALALGEGRGGPSEPSSRVRAPARASRETRRWSCSRPTSSATACSSRPSTTPRRSSSSRCGRCSTSSAATRARRCSETARSR
ncbi:chemotaxis protein CheW [Pseudenhygromyxa sp. WMMC2535]|nr:chemotaxis protein CheW [Pseudenhygromyxa sp. WMMC2535]